MKSGNQFKASVKGYLSALRKSHKNIYDMLDREMYFKQNNIYAIMYIRNRFGETFAKFMISISSFVLSTMISFSLLFLSGLSNFRADEPIKLLFVFVNMLFFMSFSRPYSRLLLCTDIPLRNISPK